FFFQAEDGIRDFHVTGVQTCALPIFREFALLPHVSAIRGDRREVCVWFSDLRFALPEMPAPFEYAMCGDGRDWELRLDAGKSGEIGRASCRESMYSPAMTRSVY